MRMKGIEADIKRFFQRARISEAADVKFEAIQRSITQLLNEHTCNHSPFAEMLHGSNSDANYNYRNVPPHRRVNFHSMDQTPDALGDVECVSEEQPAPEEICSNWINSSDNFILPRIAKFLNLPIEQAPGFKVIMGNFTVMSVERCIPSMEISIIQDYKVNMPEVYELHLAGGDMVISTTWLKQLRADIVDYDASFIRFLHDG
ncbi:uncharacterized protein DS421_2g45100 [Arachis hypogaea]|nr:uncharacterized protein DS421_2g45100 [Arachis hypogaea]